MTENAPTIRAAVYVRVSTAKQAEKGLSLDEQIARCHSEAKRRDWTVVTDYVERGVSGTLDSRPELDRMLAAASRGEFVAVVVPKLDRLGRSARFLLNVHERLKQSGVALVSVDDGIDATTPYGRAQLGMLAVFAEFEREMIAERVASVTVARVQQGKAHGRAPFGYRPGADGLVVMAAEAAVVKRIFCEYVAGKSQRQIARDLNGDGIRPQRANEWYQGTIWKLLDNPVYAGRVRLKGEEYDGRHPAIIDAGTWQKAEQLRQATARSHGGRGRSPRANHALAGGLLQCGRCGSSMGAVTKPTRTPGVEYEVYTCSGRTKQGIEYCSQEPVKRAAIDGAVWRFFENVALDIDATKTALSELHDAKLAEIDLLRDQADREAQKTADALNRIERDYRDEKLTADQWSRLDSNLRAELDAARAQAARMDQQRTALFAEMKAIDTESAVLEEIATLRAMMVGEVREGSRSSVDGFRAALRRLFQPFRLVAVVKADGKLTVVGDSEPDDRTGWYGHMHPALWLDQEPEPDGVRYLLSPMVRHDAVASTPTAGDLFPALRKAALALSGTDAKPFRT